MDEQMKALELREKTLIIEAAAPRMLSQEEELHLQREVERQVAILFAEMDLSFEKKRESIESLRKQIAARDPDQEYPELRVEIEELKAELALEEQKAKQVETARQVKEQHQAATKRMKLSESASQGSKTRANPLKRSYSGRNQSLAPQLRPPPLARLKDETSIISKSSLEDLFREEFI
eukprot:gene9097-10041_t